MCIRDSPVSPLSARAAWAATDGHHGTNASCGFPRLPGELHPPEVPGRRWPSDTGVWGAQPNEQAQETAGSA
eukprot:13491680-Alexandrium_andersonii.AAC.1